MAQTKTNSGNFFEDFETGMVIRHALPRTLTEGDNALYVALTGERYPLYCSAEFARQLGFKRELINDLLVFHTVFGKSVPDISLNAVANLGYADVRFLMPVYPGDTLRAESTVVGRKENSNGKNGNVYVHTKGYNQRNELVMQFYRWVMVHKRNPDVPCDSQDKPDLPHELSVDQIKFHENFNRGGLDTIATGGKWFFEDYETGERIYHVDGRTIEESDHMLATSSYQNTAKVHFNSHQMSNSRFGKRLMYGGHVISIARALSFNGLENALGILGWNGGSHVAPTFAGDTIYSWSDVLDKKDLNSDFGALRTRLVGIKNVDPQQKGVELKFTDSETGKETYHPNVVLDLDYYILMPKHK
ncbi:MAG: MaoC family dehydratase [SAR324 cluster bacterium]|nr:MaoC family dehydratase [SAR324 cluster bacterium]